MDELDKFREQWLEEVRTRRAPALPPHEPPSAASKPADSEPIAQVASDLLNIHGHSSSPIDPRKQQALTHYLQAIGYEHEGRLGEALASYRLAFRHCSTIDAIYRQITQGRDGAAAKAQLEQAEAMIADKKRQANDGFLFRHEAGAREMDDDEIIGTGGKSEDDPMADLVKELKKLDLQYEAEKPNRPVLVDRLPDDLLVHVLKMAGVVDTQIIGRFATACRRFAVISRDARLWKFMNSMVQKRVSSERFLEARSSVSIIEDSEDQTPSQDAFLVNERECMRQLYIEAKIYGGWLNMYMRRPRVRFDGIYISTCHYLRPSSAENTWNTPVMLVTYYRYLRFFRDGTCIKFLSTTEPAKVVKNIFWETKEKHVQWGVWRLDGRDVVAYTRDPERGNLTFCLELEVKSTKAAKNNKLLWHRYSHTDDDRDGSINEYSLRQFKPFYFSKVVSYLPQ